MAAEHRWPWISPEGYIVREMESDTKSEYVDGVIVGVSGASPEHIRICMNLTIELAPHVEASRCTAFASDMRVHLAELNRYYYPDYVVTCSKPEFNIVQGVKSLLNPHTIVEILSETTERVDRIEKWMAYRQIYSLRSYILIHQDRALIEIAEFDPASGVWSTVEVSGIDASMKFSFPDYELPLSALYRNVELGEA